MRSDKVASNIRKLASFDHAAQISKCFSWRSVLACHQPGSNSLRYYDVYAPWMLQFMLEFKEQFASAEWTVFGYWHVVKDKFWERSENELDGSFTVEELHWLAVTLFSWIRMFLVGCAVICVLRATILTIVTVSQSSRVLPSCRRHYSCSMLVKSIIFFATNGLANDNTLCVRKVDLHRSGGIYDAVLLTFLQLTND